MNQAFSFPVTLTGQAGPQVEPEEVARVHEVTDLPFGAASDLLDWLEHNGRQHFDVELNANGRMTVRWTE